MAQSTPTPAELMAEISESFNASTIESPYEKFAEYREKGSVHHGDILAEFGTTSMAAGFNGERDVYSVYGFEDCLAVLKDSETFPSEAVSAAFRPLLGKVITGVDGAEHTRLRKLLMPGLGRDNFSVWGSTIVDPVLRRLVGDLKDRGTRADLTAFVVDFPVRIVYEILGFPTEDEARFHDFQTKALTILLGFGTTDPAKRERAAANRERAIASVKALYDDLLPIVQRRRAEGATGNSLIEHLLRTEVEGESLTDDEVVVFTRSLLPAAAETTTRSFGNALVLLLNRPDVLARVRADRGLVDKAITEATRYEPVSVMAARTTAREVVLGGVTIPEGAGVSVVKGSGLRDPKVWPDADVFDVDRRMNKPNIAFGFGPHTCMGMMLAKLQMGKALNLLLDELPDLRADDEAEPMRIRGANLRQASAITVRWD
ncbi:cytochrome P450 [Actinocorallia herbida]|uniref:Cytochrome P450 n=1 Tax=Actinocorallia herbida TaxID=58109 RepID=A0A3N1D390_9ACTN|nr:cytochrome P450 [Actinocorallia herbida]ROO88004.1 cytochrome P450 [Actinocorallia herbida]